MAAPRAARGRRSSSPGTAYTAHVPQGSVATGARDRWENSNVAFGNRLDKSLQGDNNNHKLSSTPSSLTLRRRSLRSRRLLRLGERDSTLWAGQSAFQSRATRVAAATAIAASLMTWAPDSGGSCTGAGADGDGAAGGEGGGGARQTNRGPVGFVTPVFFAFLFSSSAASAASFSSYENVKSPSCVTACSGREADGGRQNGSLWV